MNMHNPKLTKRLAFLIFFIFSLNFLANKFYWYSSISYFDMIMHFLGGFWVGLLALYIFEPSRIYFKSIFHVLLLVFFIGVGWEVFEIFVDKVVTQNSFNLTDTLSDMFFDLLGGVFAIFYFIKRIIFKEANTVK